MNNNLWFLSITIGLRGKFNIQQDHNANLFFVFTERVLRVRYIIVNDKDRCLLEVYCNSCVN